MKTMQIENNAVKKCREALERDSLLFIFCNFLKKSRGIDEA